MSEQLMQVQQLPILGNEEKMRAVGAEIQNKIEHALSLPVSEETVKEVKKVRTELRKLSDEYESRRKEVKAEVLAPYAAFEAVYDEHIRNPLAAADEKLADRIKGIENGLIAAKNVEAIAYFDEKATAEGVEWLAFTQSEIKVNLSTTLTAIKKQIDAFIARVTSDVKLIMAMAHAQEILFEYKKDLDAAKAMDEVKARHAEIDAAPLATPEEVAEPIPKEPKDEPLSAPQEVEKVLTLKFTVRGTRTQLRALKEFLNNGGYDYE